MLRYGRKSKGIPGSASWRAYIGDFQTKRRKANVSNRVRRTRKLSNYVVVLIRGGERNIFRLRRWILRRRFFQRYFFRSADEWAEIGGFEGRFQDRIGVSLQRRGGEPAECVARFPKLFLHGLRTRLRQEVDVEVLCE